MFDAPEGYLIEKLKPEDEDGFVDTTMKFYSKGEPLGEIIGLSSEDFQELMKPLILDWLKHGLTIVAKTEESKEIVGMLIPQPLLKGDEQLVWGKFKPESQKAKYYAEVCAIIESAVNVVDHFGVDKAFDHSLLAVSDEHRRNGLGTALAKAANKLGEEEGYKVFAVTASNKYTAQIYEGLGFSSLYKLDYNKLKIKGKSLDSSVANGTTHAEVLGMKID
ncbi:UNVERIFIED_CONTAM: hypothetical protein RMT77_002478 [Armadillidium vulgare]